MLQVVANHFYRGTGCCNHATARRRNTKRVFDAIPEECVCMCETLSRKRNDKVELLLELESMFDVGRSLAL